MKQFETWDEFCHELESLSIGAPKSNDFLSKLKLFHDFFLSKAETMNLMSPNAKTRILTDHFYDVLLGFKEMSLTGEKVVDIGTGGGFPGILLKIAFPELDLTLVESKQKKMMFLKESSEMLGFEKINFCQTGIENLAKHADGRRSFGCLTARAVADMSLLLVWSRALLKDKGTAYFYKSSEWRQELSPRDLKSEHFFEVNMDHHGLGRKLVIWKNKA